MVSLEDLLELELRMSVTTLGVHEQPELLTPKPSLRSLRIFLIASFEISSARPMLFSVVRVLSLRSRDRVVFTELPSFRGLGQRPICLLFI